MMSTFSMVAAAVGRTYATKESHILPLTKLFSVARNLCSNHDSAYRFFGRRSLKIERQPSKQIELIKLSDSDTGIFEVVLNRPEARNAIGCEMLSGLRRLLEDVEMEGSAKVLMLSSSLPKVFCAGADLKERKEMTAAEVHSFVNTLRSTFSIIEELNIPTIAVIEGAALGGGLEMAMSCDLRICGDDAVMGLPETGLAIIPGAGGTQRLPRLVGKTVAKDLIFTGRKIGSQEALSIGLVNHCVATGSAHSKALEIAREINTKGPIGIRMAKQAIDKGFEKDMCAALKVEEECYLETLYTSDRLEGLAAFSEKRKPVYKGH